MQECFGCLQMFWLHHKSHTSIRQPVGLCGVLSALSISTDPAVHAGSVLSHLNSLLIRHIHPMFVCVIVPTDCLVLHCGSRIKCGQDPVKLHCHCSQSYPPLQLVSTTTLSLEFNCLQPGSDSSGRHDGAVGDSWCGPVLKPDSGLEGCLQQHRVNK